MPLSVRRYGDSRYGDSRYGDSRYGDSRSTRQPSAWRR
jgi:hypothetical protein